MSKELALKDDKIAPSVRALQDAINQEVEKRTIVEKYIADNLKENVDYGTIKGSSRSGKEFESKPTLFKAGSERIASLLKVRPTFTKDTDVLDMLGREGVVAFVCHLINEKGKTVGEGRGACTLVEKPDPNVCIKIAEKRAQIDAIIRTAGISDRFTQDLDDMATKPMQQTGGYSNQSAQSASKPTLNPTGTTNSARNSPPHTEKQRKYLIKLWSELGYDGEKVLAWAKKKAEVEHTADITMDQMSKLIEQTLHHIDDVKREKGLLLTRGDLTEEQKKAVDEVEKPVFEEPIEVANPVLDSFLAGNEGKTDVEVEVEPLPKDEQEKLDRFDKLKKNLKSKGVVK